MRRIKVGDKVQAFLDTRIVGTVVNIHESNKVPWMVGGTASTEFLCDLEFSDGKRATYKMSELHHYDE